MSRLSAPERREQLLDVTKAIVAARGFHAVSIEAVARDAGISRPIVYGHFDDLRGVLEALVVRESARALEQLADVLPAALGQGEPRVRLLAALRSYLDAVRADPDTWRLVLMPPEGAPDLLRDLLARGRAAVVAQLARGRPARRRLRRPVAGPGADRADALRDRRRVGAAAADRARALPGGAPDRARRLGARPARLS